jgi:hypothetical protein
MSPDQETTIREALEGIAGAEREQTLLDEGGRVIARIMACSVNEADRYLHGLIDQNKIKLTTTQMGGVLNERTPIPVALFKWSR